MLYIQYLTRSKVHGTRSSEIKIKISLLIKIGQIIARRLGVNGNNAEIREFQIRKQDWKKRPRSIVSIKYFITLVCRRKILIHSYVLPTSVCTCYSYQLPPVTKYLMAVSCILHCCSLRKATIDFGQLISHTHQYTTTLTSALSCVDTSDLRTVKPTISIQ